MTGDPFPYNPFSYPAYYSIPPSPFPPSLSTRDALIKVATEILAARDDRYYDPNRFTTAVKDAASLIDAVDTYLSQAERA